MTVALQTGQVYGIRGLLAYNLDNGTNGIRLGFLFPAARRASIMVLAETAGVGTFTVTNITAGGQSVLVTSGTTVVRSMWIDGTLVTSGTGNFMLFGANEGASGTSRFLDGSHLIFWTVGNMTV